MTDENKCTQCGEATATGDLLCGGCLENLRVPPDVAEADKPRVEYKPPVDTDYFLQNPYSSLLFSGFLGCVIIANAQIPNPEVAMVVGLPAVMLCVYYYAAIFGFIADRVFHLEINRWFAMNLVCLAAAILFLAASVVSTYIFVPVPGATPADLSELRWKYTLLMIVMSLVVYSFVFGKCLFVDAKNTLGLKKGVLLTLMSFLLNAVIAGILGGIVYCTLV